jgi:hypothetical protein
MVKLVLLLGFSVCAYSGPIAITGGSFNLSSFEVSWSLVGEGFSASGADGHFVTWCGFCFALLRLNDPVFSPVNAANGYFNFGGKFYGLPSLAYFGDVPWGVGYVFMGPQAPLPMVTAAGTWDIPFHGGASCCITDNPLVPPPLRPDPAAFPPQELLWSTIRCSRQPRLTGFVSHYPP